MPDSEKAEGALGSADLAAFVVDRVSHPLRYRSTTDVVLAPGSRNGGLALGFAEQAGGLDGARVHVRIDERSAGFLALGMAKATGGQVPVVTTSGTAAANLHPALLEAVHAGVPLLAITADRPAELVGRGANQTTQQAGMFGPLVPYFELATGMEPQAVDDVVNAALATVTGRTTGHRGPAHLNVRLAEPLLGSAQPVRRPVTADDGPRSAPLPRAIWTQPAGESWSLPGRVLVVVGECSPALARATRILAERQGWPLLAEPTSNARSGPNALRCGRLLVGATSGAAAELVARIDNLLVVGHPTLSRPVGRLLARDDLPITVVSERETFTDVAGVATHARTLPDDHTSGVHGWLAAWLSVDRVVGGRLDALLGDAFSGWSVAAAVASEAEAYAALVVGSSNPVRDLDLAPVPPVWPTVFANRGLAGIDGTVSTAAGVALELGPTMALMGDLTFLHDTNGLMIGPGEARPPLRIVVVNDDGGSIFATLEPGAPEHGAHFERVFGTPHRTDLATLCAAHGIRYKRADNQDDLVARLHDPALTLEVVEVPITRSDRRDLDQRISHLADH